MSSVVYNDKDSNIREGDFAHLWKLYPATQWKSNLGNDTDSNIEEGICPLMQIVLGGMMDYIWTDILISDIN